MSSVYLNNLKELNADKLWCGKASAREVMNALFYGIEREMYDNFPEYNKLNELMNFINNDKSNRFNMRMSTIEAPLNTGKIPLDAIKPSLTVKLIAHRLDDICIKYFHTDKRVEWIPRNKYGELLLSYWNLFTKEYIASVVEYSKTQKSPEEKKLDFFKTMLNKTQGAWANKLQKQIQDTEEKVIKIVEKAKEKESETSVQPTEQKVHEEKKQFSKGKKEKKLDDEQNGGEWIKVGKKPIKNKVKTKNPTK